MLRLAGTIKEVWRVKKAWVITIGREFCSGGAETAHKLAERLGIPYYDKELIDHVVQNTNLSREVVEEREERPENYWAGYQYGAYWYRDDPSLMLPVHTRIYEAQCDAIREMAGKGPCVIVGRCADYVLGECSHVVNTLSVFIRADMKKRVARCVRLYGLSEGEAKKLIQKTDKIRSRYYSAHTLHEWGSPQSYKLIIDAGELGTDTAAAVIEAAAKLLMD